MLEYLTFALALASMILHFVAPRTKTTTDDKVMGYVDQAKDAVDGLKK